MRQVRQVRQVRQARQVSQAVIGKGRWCQDSVVKTHTKAVISLANARLPSHNPTTFPGRLTTRPLSQAGSQPDHFPRPAHNPTTFPGRHTTRPHRTADNPRKTMTSTLAELLASGAISREEKKTDSIEVFILKDATGKCFDHKEAIKADGYKWNAAWKQWGRCTFKAEASLFDLLKMGVLTASEQDGNILVVSDGFGKTYDARGAINHAGFRWDKASKTYRMESATQKQCDAVKAINEKVATRVDGAVQARRQKRQREDKKTFEQVSNAIDRTIDAFMAQKRATCYVGMEGQATYKRSGEPTKTITKEEYSSWLALNKEFISSLPMHLSEWTPELDSECQRRCIDLRVDRPNKLVCVEYPH